ncbi:MAG: tyrosine-type recombinase/integrase, partial [Nitrospinales bacterium]|nr:tyrosine-type recombinase/integrase [Nitrospinales bacterium]
NGIRWGHEMANLDSPTSTVFVKKVLEGAKRLCEKVSNQKDPLEVEHLAELFESADSESIKDLRFLLIITLSFAGFMRISELIALKVSDIEFFDGYMRIFVEKSKCDQLREGEYIYIRQSGLSTCPVSLCKRYLQKTNLDKCNDNAIIGRLLKVKGSNNFNVSGAGPLSYTRVREIILEGLKPIKEKNPSLNFGTHSCRIGGATAAAAGGASDRLLGKHGRWKSEKSRDRYVKDSVENRLSVTKAMNI